MLDSPFIIRLLSQCKQNPMRVAFPEGNDIRTLKAAELLLEHEAVSEVVLLNSDSSNSRNHPTLEKKTKERKVAWHSAGDQKLTDKTRRVIRDSLAKKGKPLDEETISKNAQNPLYQAGALLADNQTDCVVGGAVATTADVIRAALGTVGLAPGLKTVSGSFFMDRSTSSHKETYYYADAGVVIDPTAEQLVDIAVSSSETWRKIIGTEPVVAFLSFSTKGSAKHPASEKMAKAASMFKDRCPDVCSDGDLQFDAAFVESIGKRKAPGSNVPGRANVFIFPDLGAGNIAYKITERLGGFGAFGPILQGLAKPYSDLSRGASAEDIFVSVLINALRVM